MPAPMNWGWHTSSEAEPTKMRELNTLRPRSRAPWSARPAPGSTWVNQRGRRPAPGSTWTQGLDGMVPTSANGTLVTSPVPRDVGD